MNNKFIIGDSLYLRQLELADINGNYMSWFNDEEICFGNSHHIFPMSAEQLKQYVLNESNTTLKLAIIVNNGNIHIGNITLQGINYINRSAEYAIIIGEKEMWGKGYATEASHLIIKHGFSALNLNRIYLGTYENNFGMQKLALSLGFQLEGKRREAVYKDGNYVDILEYGLLRNEYQIQEISNNLNVVNNTNIAPPRA